MQQLFRPARIMPVKNEIYAAKAVAVAVLRLDEIHPVVSGNKWFKLKAYLADAAQLKKKAILTFGGAYSNHIVATAAACTASGLQAIGIIRGEEPKSWSPTLIDAANYGMQLHFISREAYKTKYIPDAAYGVLKKSEIYSINEGGYGAKGAEGSMDILKTYDTSSYTHIVAAVGTGTMLSGLINAAAPQQQLIGINVLKNNFSVQGAIESLVHPAKNNFQINHNFHFGGYAKHTPELLRFMNNWFAATGIPTDFVYTAKAFFAADQLIQTAYFQPGSSVLLIQSGGLQGNRSLPAGVLRF